MQRLSDSTIIIGNSGIVEGHVVRLRQPTTYALQRALSTAERVRFYSTRIPMTKFRSRGTLTFLSLCTSRTHATNLLLGWLQINPRTSCANRELSPVSIEQLTSQGSEKLRELTVKLVGCWVNSLPKYCKERNNLTVREFSTTSSAGQSVPSLHQHSNSDSQKKRNLIVSGISQWLSFQVFS